jgi:cobalt-zinc-cadmium efflux system outer membrane protein
VRAAQERVTAATALADNASALKTADITLGSSVDHYPGTSTRLLEVRAQMPLQGFFGSYNYEGEVGRALAQRAQAQDALERTRLMGYNELQRQQQELRAAVQRALAFQNDIVPRARKVAEQSELAYNRGALSLTDLLDARRTLRATLLDSVNARADHAKAAGAWRLRTEPQMLADLQQP